MFQSFLPIIGILSFLLIIALFTNLTSLFSVHSKRSCTEGGTAQLTKGYLGQKSEKSGKRRVRYTTADGKEIEADISPMFIEPLYLSAQTGEEVPILYDPAHPKQVMIGKSVDLESTKSLAFKTCILTAAAVVILLVVSAVLPREKYVPIAEFDSKLLAVAEQAPAELAFSEYADPLVSNHPETVFDAEKAQQTLELLLNAQVGTSRLNVGSADTWSSGHSDFIEFTFRFEEEEYTFRFFRKYSQGTHDATGKTTVYFVQDSTGYVLGENQLNQISKLLGVEYRMLSL